MRNNIVHIGAGELTYEIREIVDVAEKLEKLGINILWENIGDPVAKGEQVPTWIKEVVREAVNEDKNFAYSPTKGLLQVREFLAEKCNSNGGVKITADDIIFFNGLGDAISKIYTSLNRESRIIGPSPAYSTHSSAEGAHAGSHHLTYNLTPELGWLPDINDLRNKVRYNPAVSGILIINPDNPTGMIYPTRVLKEIVKIAKEYDLFIISDEIYANIIFGSGETAKLSEVINEIPGIAMKGISKELPWPGARCGWIEVYNKNKDSIFARYVKSIVDAKMLEVCSTTLPQAVIPKIMSDPRYGTHLKERNERYGKRAELAYKIINSIEGVIAPKPSGAFYMSIIFKDGVLNNRQKLKIENEKAGQLVEEISKNVAPDKRFAYYLMAASGICVVPLTGFNSDLYGFRITLLEPDEEKFKQILSTLAEKINEYL
ncbi:MAG: Aminotransferase class I and II [Candidatus Wolfebacteria bacterium GW2011_GWA2_42_10]|uniref:alanine transaminase n=2 Tax=Candidatus Wolfeibacteriota TaxID=1752735 RepID=A0A0G1AK20_9BACT|nr:MAG: Aminotransferase class I and II [Candidatus Wolfebacteria bacterium GW2011_GWB1_41_12]KKS25598.1 MAG: Aminotransferase class I and II [Candidatus Wolfebacteria bacterium GW2011_GWA2_42_10]KKT56511.1 MAG: Aminotransferase class I and II [Candidatus Wolfebacteria bacterium GW2011_GWA1_44_24]